MKKALSILLILCMILSFAACGGKSTAAPAQTQNSASGSESAADGPEVTIICNTVWAPDNFVCQDLERLSKMVSERTGGKVTIRVEPGGALGYTGAEILRAVQNKELPMSEFILSGCEGDETLFGLFSQPFMLDGWDEARKFHELSRPYFAQVLESKWDQKLLYLEPWPFSCIWTKREIKSIADMAGLKTRTYDKNGALVIQNTNGTPYPLPFSEVYSSLATNLIDSVLTSTQTAVDAKFWEVLNYYQPVHMTTTVSCVSIGTDTYNSLSPAQQKVLLECCEEIEKEVWYSIEELDIKQEKVCNENGIITVPVSDEFMKELQDLAHGITTEWLTTAGDTANEVYKKFQESK